MDTGTRVEYKIRTDFADVAYAWYEGNKPVIYVNQKNLAKLSPGGGRFMLAHECAHHTLSHFRYVLQGRDKDPTVARPAELEADCEAARTLVEAGEMADATLKSIERDLTRFAREDVAHVRADQRIEALHQCLRDDGFVSEAERAQDARQRSAGAHAIERVGQQDLPDGLTIKDGTYIDRIDDDGWRLYFLVIEKGEDATGTGSTCRQSRLDLERQLAERMSTVCGSFAGKEIEVASIKYRVSRSSLQHEKSSRLFLTYGRKDEECQEVGEDEWAYRIRSKVTARCETWMKFVPQAMPRTPSQPLNEELEKRAAEMSADCDRGNMSQCFNAGSFFLGYGSPARAVLDIPRGEVLLKKGCDGGDGASCWCLGGSVLNHNRPGGDDRRSGLGYLQRSCDLAYDEGCAFYASVLKDGGKSYESLLAYEKGCQAKNERSCREIRDIQQKLTFHQERCTVSPEAFAEDCEMARVIEQFSARR